MDDTIQINQLDQLNESDTIKTNILLESVQIILIDSDIFMQFRQTHTAPLDYIQLKADTLQKTFTCFQEVIDSRNGGGTPGNATGTNGRNNEVSYESKGNNHRWGKNNAFIRSNTLPRVSAKPDKLKIGACGKEISKEDRMKREFMSFINRLSEGNRKNIPTYFQTNLQVDFIDIYFRLVWEAMLRSENFQHLYIDCFEAIYTQAYKETDTNVAIDGQVITNNNLQQPEVFMSKINVLSKTYFDSEKWIPTDELINEQDYDDFCEFVKWKKTSITYIHGFSKFVNKSWLSTSLYEELSEKLITAIKKYLSEIPEGCKVTDALLEQLLILVEYTKLDQDKDINLFIKSLNDKCQQYRPSTRFKIYDIKEYLDRKVKFIVRGKKN